MHNLLFKRYKHTTALLAVIISAALLVALSFIPVAAGISVVGLYQLSQFAMSKRSLHCYTGVLTPEQVKEFEKICGELKGHAEHFPLLKQLAEKGDGGWEETKKTIKGLVDLINGEKKRVDELQATVGKMRKELATRASGTGVRWIKNVPFVTDDCAQHIAASFVLDCARLGAKAMKQLNKSEAQHEGLIARACELLGIEVKTAMGTTQAPLPTNFISQITELVFAYGQARQYATVYPLGAGTTKLPRLTAGEDDFGFLGAGRAAGMSAAIGEKRVGVTLVSFDPSKAGGIIRIPFELEEDTFIQLGQFLSRYIARQFAKLEDNTLFLGDGTATYGNISGIIKYAQTNTDYLLSLEAGKTKPSDATLDDFRNLRNKVSAAVLSNMAANGQTAAAYYLHPTWDAKLVSFNDKNQPFNYQRGNGLAGATLDGFPVRWVGAMQPYGTAAAASKQIAVFGDIAYWYLGERGSTRIDVSTEVFFATDELAMRALESIDVQALATDAVASMQTPAA
jgi:HK97 family phage major capsid protein